MGVSFDDFFLAAILQTNQSRLQENSNENINFIKRNKWQNKKGGN